MRSFVKGWSKTKQQRAWYIYKIFSVNPVNRASEMISLLVARKSSFTIDRVAQYEIQARQSINRKERKTVAFYDLVSNVTQERVDFPRRLNGSSCLLLSTDFSGSSWRRRLRIDELPSNEFFGTESLGIEQDTHTHTHTHIYIYRREWHEMHKRIRVTSRIHVILLQGG